VIMSFKNFAIMGAFVLCTHVGAEQLDDTLIELVEGAYDSEAKGDDALTLSELMEKYRVPGVSVAVINDFKIVWSKGYGVADVETGKPVDPETLFQAASIGKPVKAMVALKAVQEGHFGLDDDINSILTSWNLPEDEFTKLRKVTPRMLLSHTSGLGDGFGFPGFFPGEPLPTPAQILDGVEPSNVGPVRVEWEPFTRFAYSGGALVMMQLALADTAGMPYEKILRSYLLDPIGMTNSTVATPLPPEYLKNVARAHIRGKSKETKWRVYPDGLWSTPTDLCKLIVDLQLAMKGESERVLSQESVREMLTPVGIGDYGLGWMVQESGGQWLIGHGGKNWGFECKAVAHRDKGWGLVVMTNSVGGSKICSALQKRIINAYDWARL